MRDIKAGEQLTVSYTNITEPRKIRAAELRATKHFVCACERCMEPLAASVDASLEASISSSCQAEDAPWLELPGLAFTGASVVRDPLVRAPASTVLALRRL